MNKNHIDKEETKQKIRELSEKIRNSDDDNEWLWESYESSIATLIIDYSIRHGIIIPLIDYAKYQQLGMPPIESQEDAPRPLKRRKVDQPGEVDNSDYDFFQPFLEAIGEEGMKNPRFSIHPDIKDLVNCWSVNP
jgi:hypothetical protein